MKKLFLISLVLFGGSFNAARAGAATPKPTLLTKELLGYIEPQEYLRTARTQDPSKVTSGPAKKPDQTTLIQIPVLDQSKESEKKGSSKHSSGYHALRNGIILLKALIDPSYPHCIEGIGKLYDKNDLHNALSYEGTWRNTIRGLRQGNFTDSLSMQELKILMDAEKATEDLAGKNIPFAYFEYANADEPTERDFELLTVSKSLKNIKRKLAADEDFAALIIVYADTHAAHDPLLEKKSVECMAKGEDCTGRAFKKTPCCGNTLCDRCWAESLDDNHGTCPMCSLRKPGALSDEITKLALDKPLPGHYVALVLAKVQDKRQYFLMDSANELHRFTTNKPIKRLLQYLEDPNEPQETDATLLELPRFIPDPSRLYGARAVDFETEMLMDAFKDYKDSYTIGHQKAPAALQRKIDSSHAKVKGFIGGVLGIGALYACLSYYQRSHKPNSQQTTTPTVL